MLRTERKSGEEFNAEVAEGPRRARRRVRNGRLRGSIVRAYPLLKTRRVGYPGVYSWVALDGKPKSWLKRPALQRRLKREERGGKETKPAPLETKGAAPRAELRNASWAEAQRLQRRLEREKQELMGNWGRL